MLMDCGECKTKVSDKAENCPNCGAPSTEFFNDIIDDEKTTVQTEQGDYNSVIMALDADTVVSNLAILKIKILSFGAMVLLIILFLVFSEIQPFKFLTELGSGFSVHLGYDEELGMIIALLFQIITIFGSVMFGFTTFFAYVELKGCGFNFMFSRKVVITEDGNGVDPSGRKYIKDSKDILHYEGGKSINMRLTGEDFTNISNEVIHGNFSSLLDVSINGLYRITFSLSILFYVFVLIGFLIIQAVATQAFN